MSNVLKVFMSLSLSGSLIIIILFLCKRFWKDRVGRQWQYYIWLIVIARLLLPFAPETNLVGHIFQTDTVMQQQQEQGGLQEIDKGSAPQVEGKPDNWLVWLIIAFVLLIRKITVYQGFVRYVKAGRVCVSDIGLLDRLSVLAEQTGIKRPVELCVNPLISSPLLIGFFRPCIVLPSTDISEKDFRYTALHELTHYRRRDMFYKWLVQVTVCLHWFNPLVYLMSREINKACEFSCDEAVIAGLGHGSAQEYARTLLDAMVKAGNYKESLASFTLNESKELLKERLGAIMSYKKKSKLTTAFSVVLTAAIMCMATFTGAYAATAKNTAADQIGENNTDGKETGTVVINLSNGRNQNSLIHSSSFQAGDGQVLTLKITSTIKGTVDLTLFSPSNQQQRITIGGNNDTKTIDLSEGTWSYNCTGFFDSGDISIIGTVTGGNGAAAKGTAAVPIGVSKADGKETGTVVINLSNNKDQNSLLHSSSFQAGDGQVLTLKITSSIKGTVNLTLFSPSHQEQRITISGNNDTKTVDLSAGTWAYNCTGFFDSGDISIVGTVK